MHYDTRLHKIKMFARLIYESALESYPGRAGGHLMDETFQLAYAGAIMLEDTDLRSKIIERVGTDVCEKNLERNMQYIRSLF